MQSVGDASTKRPASPTLPCVSSSILKLHTLHDSCKRRRTSNHPSMTQDSPLVPDLLVACLSKRDSLVPPQEQPSPSAPPVTDGRAENFDSYPATGKSPDQQIFNHRSKGNRRNHNFYTKASILTPQGMVVLQQVQVYERISPNLLPWSMAMDLNLPVYPDKILTLTLNDQVIQTSQYCKFIIRVAGIDAEIDAWMILGLKSVILGRDWIQTVNLFSDFDKKNYFIPVHLVVEAAGENFPNIRVPDGEF
jgi:hypothetical protein